MEVQQITRDHFFVRPGNGVLLPGVLNLLFVGGVDIAVVVQLVTGTGLFGAQLQTGGQPDLLLFMCVLWFIFTAPLFLYGGWCLLHRFRSLVEVDGDIVHYTPPLGARRSYSYDDIRGIAPPTFRLFLILKKRANPYLLAAYGWSSTRPLFRVNTSDMAYDLFVDKVLREGLLCARSDQLPTRDTVYTYRARVKEAAAVSTSPVVPPSALSSAPPPTSPSVSLPVPSELQPAPAAGKGFSLRYTKTLGSAFFLVIFLVFERLVRARSFWDDYLARIGPYLLIVLGVSLVLLIVCFRWRVTVRDGMVVYRPLFGATSTYILTTIDSVVHVSGGYEVYAGTDKLFRVYALAQNYKPFLELLRGQNVRELQRR
ncbi:MAG: hypothetical protein LBC23_02835 [Coriobacteriales bacterium]|nr:hypothetical protein [Coriobacteriales bacterium]